MRKPSKKVKSQCLATLAQWAHDNRVRIEHLRPDFRKWVNREIEKMRDTIDSGDFSVICLSSHARHVATSLRRMEAGEIVALIGETGFQLAGSSCDT